MKRSERLVEARGLAYVAFLDQFPAGDRELFESLPDLPGVREYGEAIDGFERERERLPRTVEDVARAAAAGRRLAERRDHVENEAVPPGSCRDAWRALRGEGFPLPELSEQLRAWLEERDLAGSVLLRYRSSWRRSRSTSDPSGGREARLLTWGFVDGGFALDELEMLADEFPDNDETGALTGADLSKTLWTEPFARRGRRHRGSAP